MPVDDRLSLGAVGAKEGGGRDGLQSLLRGAATLLLQPAEGDLPLARALTLGEVAQDEAAVDVVVLATLLRDAVPPRVVVVDDHGDGVFRERPALGERGDKNLLEKST